MRPDLDKIKEIVLYLAEKSVEDRYWGGTKLNKILFWADVRAFRETGQSITGMRYRKAEWGPIPTALIPALKQLEAEGAYEEKRRRIGRGTQKRIVAKREADLSLISDYERTKLDQAIEDLWNHTATSVSEWSHEFPGYVLTEMGDEISLSQMLLRKLRPLTRDEQRYAKEVFAGVGE